MMDADAGHEQRQPGEVPERHDGRRDAALADAGILESLPRTRPQRSSPRRAAAQARGTKAKAASTAKPPSPRRSASARKAVPQTPARPRKAAPQTAVRPRKAAPQTTWRRREPPAPKQGYEPEDELELGRSVHPPSGAELVESVADIFVELASAGLKAGGRALKDVLSPLRRS